MTTESGNGTHDWDGCLLCAVRALTLGSAPVWKPEVGDTVTGVLVRIGTTTTSFAPPGESGVVPTYDLWTGGMSRVRVVAYGSMLRSRIAAEEPEIGDTVTITRGEDATIPVKGLGFGPRFTHTWTVTVKRGHH